MLEQYYVNLLSSSCFSNIDSCVTEHSQLCSFHICFDTRELHHFNFPVTYCFLIWMCYTYLS